MGGNMAANAAGKYCPLLAPRPCAPLLPVPVNPCLSLPSGMAPSPEFGMDVKLNPAQKMNSKVDGTPKSDSKKVSPL